MQPALRTDSPRPKPLESGRDKTPLSVGVATAVPMKVLLAPGRHCAVGAQVVQGDAGRLAPTMAVCVVMGRPHLLGDCCNKGVDVTGAPHRNAGASFDRLGVLARFHACIPASAGNGKTAQDLGETDQGFRMCHGWPFIQGLNRRPPKPANRSQNAKHWMQLHLCASACRSLQYLSFQTRKYSESCRFRGRKPGQSPWKL